jgi:DNA-binding NtrC family response regulator
MAANLNLLSFAEAGTSQQVRECLEGLGYAVAPLEGRFWLNREDLLEGATVALFSPPALDPVRVSDLLDRIDAKSTLTLLYGADDVDQELLCFSDELAFWPCGIAELDGRLRRLYQRVGTGGCVQKSPADTDSLAELNLIGRSPPFRAVLANVRRIAGFNLPILLQGETGTGKEVLARAIHYLGPRQNAAFVPVNCGAIPAELMESEFYGHTRGAFTDAKQARTGLVELADGGTLFLDEIDSLCARGQVSLLRFLQNQEFRSVGGRTIKQANVRVVAAGNRPLKDLVQQEEFREDLYYRLSVFPLELPPLRRRGDDVLELARHFLDRYSRLYGTGRHGFSADAVAWLSHYAWPGNVRELENSVHRACLLSSDEQITAHCLMADSPVDPEFPVLPGGATEELEKFAIAKQHAVERFERRYLEDMMRRTKGNVSAAACLAGKERRAFGKLLKKHGLCRQNFS